MRGLRQKGLTCSRFFEIQRSPNPTLKEFHKEWSDKYGNYLDFMERWVKEAKDFKIPDRFDPREIGSSAQYWKERGVKSLPPQVEGADLRQLRALLEQLDPPRRWGGLVKVHTPEGHYLWLCEDHAEEFKR